MGNCCSENIIQEKDVRSYLLKNKASLWISLRCPICKEHNNAIISSYCKPLVSDCIICLESKPCWRCCSKCKQRICKNCLYNCALNFIDHDDCHPKVI